MPSLNAMLDGSSTDRPLEDQQLLEDEELPEDLQLSEDEELPEDVQLSEDEELPEDLQLSEDEELPEDLQLSEDEEMPEDLQLVENKELPEDLQLAENEETPEDLQLAENLQLAGKELLADQKLSNDQQQQGVQETQKLLQVLQREVKLQLKKAQKLLEKELQKRENVELEWEKSQQKLKERQQKMKEVQQTLGKAQQDLEKAQQLLERAQRKMKEMLQKMERVQHNVQELDEALNQPGLEGVLNQQKLEEILNHLKLEGVLNQQHLNEAQELGGPRQQVDEAQQQLKTMNVEILEMRQQLDEVGQKIQGEFADLQRSQKPVVLQEVILRRSGLTGDAPLDTAATEADRLQPQTLRRFHLSSPRPEPLLDEILVAHSNALEVVKLSSVTPRSSASVGTLGLLALCRRLRVLGLPPCDEMPLLLECPDLVVLELYLDGGELGSAAVYLRDAVRLTSLSLYCQSPSSEVAGDAVGLVGALSSSRHAVLERLRIDSSELVVDGDLTSSALAALAGLPRLRELYLSGVPPASFITALANELPSLRLLDFGEARAALGGSDCPVPALRALLAARPALHVKGVASRGAACGCLGCADKPWRLLTAGAPCGFYAHDHGKENCGVEHDGGLEWYGVT